MLEDLEEQIISILLKQDRLMHQSASVLLIAKIRGLRTMGKLHPPLLLNKFETRLHQKANCHSNKAYNHYFKGGEKQHHTNQYCRRDTHDNCSSSSPRYLVRSGCVGVFDPQQNERNELQNHSKAVQEIFCSYNFLKVQP
uniref:Uncharacterized protein n=1 Tax=Glycine max TaxID=3847 RepID=C6TDS5_SOYBN|nr:unknown [Glycine max]